MQAALELPATSRGRAPRHRLHASPVVGLLAVAPIAVIGLLLVVVLWVSFQRGIVGTASAEYSLLNYREVFLDPFSYGAMLNTLAFAVVTIGVALLIGLPIAWLAERTTLPGKPLVYAIMTLGLLVPGIYQAIGWTFIAHPRIGFVNQWLMGAFNLSSAPLNMTTPPGMGFVQGLSLTPLA